jgi:hypothetical protein
MRSRGLVAMVLEKPLTTLVLSLAADAVDQPDQGED